MTPELHYESVNVSPPHTKSLKSIRWVSVSSTSVAVASYNGLVMAIARAALSACKNPCLVVLIHYLVSGLSFGPCIVAARRR